MAYTVKQVAAMSGASVRALHYYDETGLLKPAFYGANGYRFYEEQELLALQQILFYRELGLTLKQIKRILGRRDFEKVAALRSHRMVLQRDLSRTRTLIATIEKTIQHLQGRKKMKTEEMFAGFTVAAGKDRYGDRILLGGEPVDCKVSGKDTAGALCVFEVTAGWPRHLHHDQDEWLYVIDGEVELELGKQRLRVGAGESVFIPRNTEHVWAPAGGPGKFINVYQPAGKIEEFFRVIGNTKDLPTK
jgi:DNA-binding transcriptional MerR regulator/uncharacterized cupin superfamily protein